MGLKETIEKDAVEAMKNKDTLKLSVLRMVKAAIKNKEIEKRADLDDPQVVQILSTLIKQRRDSVEQFTKGNRQDLADKESEEIKIIQSYLPESLSEDEITRVVDDTIRELGAKSVKDFGLTMKAVMVKLAGKGADGKLVSSIVNEKLTNL